MGFNSSATTLTVNAKLTPLGRKLMVSTNNSLISTFALGDSDANYKATVLLGSGEVPSSGGDVGTNNSVGNSTASNINIKSRLIYNGNGNLTKPVESQSTSIFTEPILNGQVTVSGSYLTQSVINRNNYTTDSLVNLFYSFGLPLNSADDTIITGVTYANGGFSDTAVSGIAVSNIVVFGIDNSKYGESIDGKTMKFVLPTTGSTYNIYSTYQRKGSTVETEDGNFRDTSTTSDIFGSNIAFLFSDNIMTPNGGSASLSWATGNGTVKPFSLNGKQLFNLQTNTTLGYTADTLVGIAFLDKGFLVITDPTIVADYGDYNATGVTTGATVTFDSVSTNVYQSITCIAGRGEFGASTNPTFTGIENPRITEVALYDTAGNIIAFGKLDRQQEKNINEFLALGVTISL